MCIMPSFQSKWWKLERVDCVDVISMDIDITEDTPWILNKNSITCLFSTNGERLSTSLPFDAIQVMDYSDSDGPLTALILDSDGRVFYVTWDRCSWEYSGPVLVTIPTPICYMKDGVLVDVNGKVWDVTVIPDGESKCVETVFPVKDDIWSGLRENNVDLTGVVKVYEWGWAGNFLLVMVDGSIDLLHLTGWCGGKPLPVTREKYPHFSF